MSKQSNQRYRKEKDKELMKKSNNNNATNLGNNLPGKDKLSGHEFDNSSNSVNK